MTLAVRQITVGIGLIFILGGCAETFPKTLGESLQAETPASLLGSETLYNLRPYDVVTAAYFFLNQEGTFNLRSGDEVEVRFATAPDLNVTQTVRTDGKVSLPYLGDVKIGGMTASQARGVVTGGYANIFPPNDVFFGIVRSHTRSDELRAVISSNDEGQRWLARVGPDGRSSLPGIGTFTAAGRPVDEVEAEVNDRYAEAGWGDVRVTLGLLETQPVNVYVLGAVAQPGAYPITTTVSLQQAVAQAGGYRDDADLESIYLLRKDDGTYELRKFETEMLFLAGGTSILELKSDDVVYVPRSGLSITAEKMRELADILLLNGFTGGASLSYPLRR
ncbi:polysaccharide biosynthesis/export family protein [Rhodospira trueperi]|uniref:Polysaccharide export outer membrane protein n=1 Tax=Rhodospira trueperi TaxID=69960 RepID=A0A1G7BYH3_9PROT|nr:polysaccharide biosynthesis/export family protein [Rhodospira trueperi]SDE32089.1 polysaccharide export outer membrane protein [Rhodospira trueperi]